MKKRALISFVLAIVLAIGVSAAENFVKTKTYQKGTFADVAESEWYYKEVVSAYELGFMNGLSETNFGADGSVTVAQGITIAARINSIYNGGDGVFTQGDVWYQVYVDYAKEKGFLKDGQFDDFNRAITRGEMASLVANALPAESFTAINAVEVIPDVNSSAAYFAEILKLYNAGIVMGNDNFGTFYPNNNIKRSEVSAIINRVAISENRLKKTLAVRTLGDAVYLISDLSMTMGHTGLTSGWNYDNRFEIMNTNGKNKAYLSDTSEEGFQNINRQFLAQNSGVLTLETHMGISKDSNGAYILFTNENNEDAFKILYENETFYAVGAEKVKLEVKEALNFKIVMDLDLRVASVYLNGTFCGTHAMNTSNKELSRLYIGTSAVGKAAIDTQWVALYANYLVNEAFVMSPEKTVPGDWNLSGEMSVKATGGTGLLDSNSMQINAKAGTTSVAAKSFASVSGNVIYETALLLPKGESGVYVSLNSGETEGIRVVSENNTFKTGKGVALRTFTNNIWQFIRIEADTKTGKALIRIDGRNCGTVDFDNAVSSFDNVKIGYVAKNDSVVYFDDVKVFPYVEPEDYCPVPQKVESKDYYVGLNVCSLWRNGHHFGWDVITPYPDLEPALGYYDEGIVELADWEIKFMVEHGIDYQHLCWYCPSGNQKEPIKRGRMNEALHDGIFNAKYGDMIKFNFMWENSGINTESLEQFKEFIWSYWKEYYFSNPNFMTMDNKIVFTTWSYGNFVKGFGGEEGAKEAIKFMNEDAKTLGFDGMILLFADGHSMNKDFFKGVTNIGADGTYGYHWNVDGKAAAHQIYRMSTQQEFNVSQVVPTLSVGFNNIGWSGVRKDMISLEGHKEVAEYIKNIHLKKYDQNTWQGKAVMISTWNEFGEGTYVMPAAVHGFGYLDTIREVFTDAKGIHKDAVPTEAQKERLGYLFPRERSLIRALDLEKKAASEIPSGIVKKWDMKVSEDAAAWDAFFGVEDFKREKGVISGQAKTNDFAVLAENLDIDLAEATFIHIRMKTSAESSFEIFFTTKDSAELSEDKSYKGATEAKDGYVDYYCDMQGIKTWKGNLTQLRFDPMNSIGTFEIELIEILCQSEEDKPMSICINNYEIANRFDPEVKGDEVYVACEPLTGILSLQNLYYEFSRFTGKLLLKNKDTEFRFAVGSDKVLVNGKEMDLGYKFYLRDGLPVLPMVFMAKQMDYPYTIDKNKLSITTIDKKYIDAIENRVPLQYEFEIPGDAEGVTAGNATFSIEDGKLFGATVAQNEASGYPAFDPIINPPAANFSAKKYKTIEISMMHDFAEGTDRATIYFSTEASPALDENKTVSSEIGSNTSDGKFVKYTFDMASNPLWKGTVKSIRFDPINHEGTFSIDYIRLIPDESVTDDEASEESVSTSLKNPDAEGEEVAFKSDNSTISIVKDPENEKNRVYMVQANSGKNWTYFLQDMKFKNDTKYLVEFDVKVLTTSDGNANVDKVDVYLNLQYKDNTDVSDHIINIPIGTADGWLHFAKEMTISNSTDRSRDKFSIFCNPVAETSVSYMIDNIKLTEIKK